MIEGPSEQCDGLSPVRHERRPNHFNWYRHRYCEPEGLHPLDFMLMPINWNGTTAISYRGTSWSSLVTGISDVLFGWPGGVGANLAPQLVDAVNFYTDETGKALNSGAQGNVLLVGHSLGGGLAGYIAALTGDSADIFDTMPYGAATLNQYALENNVTGIVNLFSFLTGNSWPYPDPPNGGNVTSEYVSSEILNNLATQAQLYQYFRAFLVRTPLGTLLRPILQWRTRLKICRPSTLTKVCQVMEALRLF